MIYYSLLRAFSATMISLNVQSKDKAVAWCRSKLKSIMKTASDQASSSAFRNSELKSNFLSSCRSKRSISATILSLDNEWFVECEVAERERLTLLRMLFYSKSSFDHYWWVKTVLTRSIHRSQFLLELEVSKSKNESFVWRVVSASDVIYDSIWAILIWNLSQQDVRQENWAVSQKQCSSEWLHIIDCIVYAHVEDDDLCHQ